MKPEVIYVFSVICFFTSGFLLVQAAYAFHFRKTRGAISFMLILIIASIHTTISGYFLLHNTYQVAQFWLFYTFCIFCALNPVLWLIFALQFTSRDSHLTLPVIMSLFFIPVITISLVFGAPENPLFLYNLTYEINDQMFIMLDQDFGPYFWIHTTYSFLIIIIGSSIILMDAAHLPVIYRKQSYGLVFAAFFPVALSAIRTFKILPIYQIPSLSISLLLSSLIFSEILFRHRMLNIKPIAKRLLIDSMSDAMLVFDANRILIDFNFAAKEIFDQSIDITFGKKADDIFLNNENITRQLIEGFHATHELCIAHNKKTMCFDVKISPILDKKRKIGSLLVFRDVSDRKMLEKNLHDLAMVDSLTGFYNYGYFLEFGRREIKRANRNNGKLSAIMIDIDHFKIINDTYGHLCGNQVIRSFAKICRDNIRSIDIVARYGGDEFIILLPDTKSHTAMQIAERIRRSIDEIKISTITGEIDISISLGVVSLSARDVTDIEVIVERSDQALYQSKRNGRNQVSLWKSDSGDRAKKTIHTDAN